MTYIRKFELMFSIILSIQIKNSGKLLDFDSGGGVYVYVNG